MADRYRPSRPRRPAPYTSDALTIAGGIAATVLVVGAIAVSTTLPYQNVRALECTVTDKDRTRTDSGSDMRVYTDQCGTLRVGDLPFIGLTDSADLFGDLQPGHTYDLTVGGYRNGWLSMFPTIHTAADVTP